MEDLYIEMLRYGKECLANGVTMPETLSYLQKLQPESVLVESEHRFHNTFVQVFQLIAGTDSFTGSQRYTLNMEGYFNLLEHDELQQARKSSRNGLWVAIGAIVISGVLASVSIAVSIVQLATGLS